MRITLDGEPFELTPELVRARIGGRVPEGIRDYWVEIDGARWPVEQVISLATGVTDRQRFQSQSSRLWLINLGFTIGKGNSALPVVPRRAAAGKRTSQPRLSNSGRASDIVLIGCVKSKLEHGAPAKDLYDSDYFLKMRAYAEASGRPWFILSAEHGLVRPDDWLEPYERYLPDMPRDYRRAWGEKVAVQLAQAVRPLAGLVIEIHAGAAYVEFLYAPLRSLGADVIDELQGKEPRGVVDFRGILDVSRQLRLRRRHQYCWLGGAWPWRSRRGSGGRRLAIRRGGRSARRRRGG